MYNNAHYIYNFVENFRDESHIGAEVVFLLLLTQIMTLLR